MAIRRKLCLALLVLCGVNFLAFVVLAEKLGGDAINGKVEDGRYYLSNHGRTTEVTRRIFIYSHWHARSIFVTHPLGMILLVVCFGDKMQRKKTAKPLEP
jgi:hypothetical protein